VIVLGQGGRAVRGWDFKEIYTKTLQVSGEKQGSADEKGKVRWEERTPLNLKSPTERRQKDYGRVRDEKNQLKGSQKKEPW